MAFISNSITGSVLGNSVGTSSFAETASFAFSLVNPPIAGAIISASSPGTQPSGTLWWNSEDGNLYLQVSVSSGSTYVPATTTVAGSTFGATFREFYAGATWNVSHNLGTTSPIIQVYSGSEVMIPDTITSVDENTSTITFASAVSGSVVASTGVGGQTSASFALKAVSATTASYAETTPQLDYLFFQGTSTQTVAQGDTLNLWNNVGGYNQGQITYNTNGQFTLKAGKKYELESDFYATAWSSTTGGYLWLGWRIVSGTGTIYNKDSTVVPSTHTTDRSSTSLTKAFITTVTDVVVHVTVALAAGSADIQGTRSFASIKEIK